MRYFINGIKNLVCILTRLFIVSNLIWIPLFILNIFSELYDICVLAVKAPKENNWKNIKHDFLLGLKRSYDWIEDVKKNIYTHGLFNF